MDYRSLEARLQSLLGDHAAVRCCSTDGDVSTLAGSEFPTVVQAVAHRQKEFAAGRAAARDAMQRLGRPAASIPMQADRSPRWPQDLVGSISHSRATCIAVVALKPHWRAVGVDVEPDQDLPRDLWEFIGRPEEIQRAAALPEALQPRWMMRVFSAKEAYYKCVYPRMQRVLEFHEVEIVMDVTLDSTDFFARLVDPQSGGNSQNTLSGRLMIEQGMVISLLVH